MLYYRWRKRVIEITAYVTVVETEAFLGISAQQATVPDGVTAI